MEVNLIAWSSIDQNQRRPAGEALDSIIDEGLAEITGSPHRAHKALLALLGDRLLQEQANGSNRTQNDSIRKGVQYG